MVQPFDLQSFTKWPHLKHCIHSLLRLALARASLGLGFDDRHLESRMSLSAETTLFGALSHLRHVVGRLVRPLTSGRRDVHDSRRRLTRLLTRLDCCGKVGSGLSFDDFDRYHSSSGRCCCHARCCFVAADCSCLPAGRSSSAVRFA